jgi:hypothetical protein
VIPATGFIGNIFNIYFHEYIPRAAAVGASLRALGKASRLAWTAHPWLLYWYFHCDAISPIINDLLAVRVTCPTSNEIAVARGAVATGDSPRHYQQR